MYKYRMTVAVLICLALLTVACVPNIDPSEKVTTLPTVLDQFTDPTTAHGTNSTESSEDFKSSFISVGPSGIKKRDENGFYYLYEGGEMCVPFSISCDGAYAEHNIGILMFVDGQLQPYKTKNDDTYRYMHFVSPEENVQLLTDLYFVPVSGEEGETLDVWFAGIWWPEYSYLEDGYQGLLFGSSIPETGSRLKIGEPPSESELPTATDRVISWTVSQEPLTSKDTRGWSEEDFQIKCVQNFAVNPDEPMNQRFHNVWNIFEDKPLKVRFEVYGNPFVHYGLVFFLDNEPVSMAPEDIMFISVEEGYKTVVEAEIDMTGFDGESSIYAALIPRNYFTTEILTDSVLNMSTHYMLYAEDPVPKAP